MIVRLSQERMKVREVIPQIGPIPIVIPLKLFLEGIDFLADNVTSRVTKWENDDARNSYVRENSR